MSESSTALAMTGAGLALLAIGLAAARHDLAHGRPVDKVLALAYLCFGLPLAMFGAEHLTSQAAMTPMVPKYMPFRAFWVNFVGVALIAAGLSIAAKKLVRWSGLLLGAMMFLFVAMLHFPNALAAGGRIFWTIVFRELSFGGGGWVLAGIAMGREHRGKGLIVVGRAAIAVTALFFGVEHFLHPLGLPGVPLVKQMPAWVPLASLIDYVTGALLISAGISFALVRSTRLTAASAGGWIVLVVAAIYMPVLVGALQNPRAAVQVEGLNYFADTLLFGGAILSVGKASSEG